MVVNKEIVSILQILNSTLITTNGLQESLIHQRDKLLIE